MGKSRDVGPPESGVAHLVNLAGADRGSRGPSAADGESEGGRSDSTSRGGGREGRASRAGDGGNAATKGKIISVSSIGGQLE